MARKWRHAVLLRSDARYHDRGRCSSSLSVLERGQGRAVSFRGHGAGVCMGGNVAGVVDAAMELSLDAKI